MDLSGCYELFWNILIYSVIEDEDCLKAILLTRTGTKFFTVQIEGDSLLIFDSTILKQVVNAKRVQFSCTVPWAFLWIKSLHLRNVIRSDGLKGIILCRGTALCVCAWKQNWKRNWVICSATICWNSNLIRGGSSALRFNCIFVPLHASWVIVVLICRAVLFPQIFSGLGLGTLW